ncbi:MAG: hypothetical protein JW700_04350 [Candidatus Aenigmarchaeota archaeon]|nr:hypothetical protein [Candidatus Aenigmarchaeota archaeon]
MKTKLLLTVLSIVLVAGCVDLDMNSISGGSVTGSGRGLEMTSFTAEPSSVFSGSSVRLMMEVENLGGTNVDAGDSVVYITGSNFDDWNDGSSAVFESLKDMRAQDVVRGVPASTDRVTATLTAPDLEPGQTRNDVFIGRVYHDYKTSANGNIWVYSEAESEASREAGRSLDAPSFTYTKGPVGIAVSVSPTPIILYDEGENSFTAFITISNLASGTIYAPGSLNYDSNSVQLTMDQMNRVDVDVVPDSGLNILSSEDCEGQDLELVAGRDLVLVCDIEVNDDVPTFESFSFDVTVSYGYYTEERASVTIQGR